MPGGGMRCCLPPTRTVGPNERFFIFDSHARVTALERGGINAKGFDGLLLENEKSQGRNP